MSDFGYGFVCIMDALGTKGAWRHETPTNLISKLKSLQQNFQVALKLNPTKGVGKLDVQIFSDTVFVTYMCPEEQDKQQVLLLPWFFEFLVGPFVLSLFDGLLLRGAISQGLFHQSETMLVGPAVDDAATYYERANWLGITATPSASFGMEYAVALGQRMKPDIEHNSLMYNVPMKDQEAERLCVVDWPKFFDSVIEEADENIKGREKLIGIFSKYPIPQHATSKYLHTLAFYDFSIQKQTK